MADDNDGSTEDRFERIPTDFHERLRNGYLTIAKHDPKRCVVVDALQSVDEIHGQILKYLQAL
jgi:dTMP kinase